MINFSDNQSALIVIDVQNDFCSGGALAVPGGEQVVPVINRLLPHFSCVVATQDWHPAGHFSFASSHSGKNPYDTVPFMDTEQLLWPDHCIGGTAGAAFHPDLDTAGCSLILRKGMSRQLDSYSAFYENDRKTATGLAGYLRACRIHRLVICGLATDFCVFYSAQDAVNLGFDVHIVNDAVRGVGVPEGNIEKSLEVLQQIGVRFHDSETII